MILVEIAAGASYSIGVSGAVPSAQALKTLQIIPAIELLFRWQL